MAPSSSFSMFDDAIATVLRTSQAVADRIQTAVHATQDQLAPAVYQFVEHSTTTVGKVVAPITDHPLIRFATKVPGVSWLLAVVGQVNRDRVQRDVAELRRQYPADTPDQLAQRLIRDTAWKAAGVGLATNFIPPLALTLIAIDLGAIAALQAEMIYRIAAIYGFSPDEAARRGEVLTVWGVFTGSSELVKLGLSAVELVPGVGAIVGTASDATLVYTIGQLACLFYQEKLKALDTPEIAA